ncbi:MAG: immune inhibitor A, partial [Desulfobacteraceae bacterium]
EIREFDEGLQAYPFYEDFESGTDNWIISGTNWNLTDTSSVSATHSLTESVGGSYPNYAHSVAETAGFMDLTTATFPVLTFWYKCRMSTHSYSDDYIYVDVSTDGGWTWTNIWSKHDHNQSTWRQVKLDLSSYMGDMVKIRFRLLSDESYTADGFSIDDVEIREFDEGLQAYPFYEDFESGTDNWIISGTNWNLTDTSSVSAAHSLTESVGGDYPNYAHSVAETAGFMDLTTATFPVLTFWHKCSTSTHSYSDEYNYVDVSTDGGMTWTNIWSKHDLNQSTWVQEMIDLTPYISSQVKIRFRFVSDESYVADGWYIDDVEVSEFE